MRKNIAAQQQILKILKNTVHNRSFQIKKMQTLI